MEKIEQYPYSLKSVLQENKFENILDSNMFSAYIPRELPIPRIDDPRKAEASVKNTLRHPGYIRSAKINQIFSYLGFIKRTENRRYREYLPVLFQELKKFFSVFEDIIFTLDVTISEEIFLEQKSGFQNFIDSYSAQTHNEIEWIEKIWKHQKIYLENIDMLLETLKLRGQVFDFKEDLLYEEILAFCENYFHDNSSRGPGNTDYHFVANCCTKAARDNKPKTIWSGDRHITKILTTLYKKSHLRKELPGIYLRASYDPRHYSQLFP